MSKRVNQRWPDGLYERAEAAAAAMDGCSVTDLTVLALERTIAEMPWASGSAPSSEAPKREPWRGGYPSSKPVEALRRPPPGPAPGAGSTSGEKCPHPKTRRSRGQCMACFAYLDAE